MEAAAAAKPLISASDSGGVLRLAAHFETGWVADPNPHSIADALSEAAAHPERCLLMGRAARERWNRLDVTWAQTLEQLLS